MGAGFCGERTAAFAVVCEIGITSAETFCNLFEAAIARTTNVASKIRVSERKYLFNIVMGPKIKASYFDKLLRENG